MEGTRAKKHMVNPCEDNLNVFIPYADRVVLWGMSARDILRINGDSRRYHSGHPNVPKSCRISSEELGAASPLFTRKQAMHSRPASRPRRLPQLVWNCEIGSRTQEWYCDIGDDSQASYIDWLEARRYKKQMDSGRQGCHHEFIKGRDECCRWGAVRTAELEIVLQSLVSIMVTASLSRLPIPASHPSASAFSVSALSSSQFPSFHLSSFPVSTFPASTIYYLFAWRDPSVRDPPFPLLSSDLTSDTSGLLICTRIEYKSSLKPG